MARLYRCNHEGCETSQFEADIPVCPTCGTDGRDPHWKGFIAPLVTIHFVGRAKHPTGKSLPNVRSKTRACDSKPAVGLTDGSHAVTGEPLVVNCAACRATDAWKAEAPEEGDGKVPSHLDYPVELKGGCIQTAGQTSQSEAKPV